MPGCTERCVTVSGSGENITQCIYHICCVMLGETKDKTCREPGLTLLYVQRVRRRAALYSTSRAGGWLAMIPRDELEQEGEEERLMLLPDFWDWEEEELER